MCAYLLTAQFFFAVQLMPCSGGLLGTGSLGHQVNKCSVLFSLLYRSGTDDQVAPKVCPMNSPDRHSLQFK